MFAVRMFEVCLIFLYLDLGNQSQTLETRFFMATGGGRKYGLL